MSIDTTTHANAPMPRELSFVTIDLIAGGADLNAECQTFQTLASMVNNVMKNFSSALATAARG